LMAENFIVCQIHTVMGMWKRINLGFLSFPENKMGWSAMKTSFHTGMDNLGKSSFENNISTFEIGQGFDIHNEIISFGKFTGVLWTRCEIDYLKWLYFQRIQRPVEIKNKHYKACDVAGFELERRGTNLNERLYITAHAVERATERYLTYYEIWRDSNTGGGVYKWLTEMATKAIQHLEFGENKVMFHNMVFVFQQELNCDILKTVI